MPRGVYARKPKESKEVKQTTAFCPHIEVSTPIEIAVKTQKGKLIGTLRIGELGLVFRPAKSWKGKNTHRQLSWNQIHQMSQWRSW